MPLGFQHRRVGEVTVVTCAGRLAAGEESAAFQSHLDSLMAMNPRIVLHLGGVEFIDSGGVGVLVRYFMRAQNARGALTLCAVSPKVADVLKITRLNAVFQPYATEAEAIADAHGPGRRADPSLSSPNVLCVDSSPDVLGYLREVLKEAGYGPLTAANVSDALILLIATRPTVVVMGAGIGASTDAGAGAEFRRHATARALVELPADFAGRDAADAAQQVLEAVRVHLAPRNAAS